jgi:hypothetical protein
MDVLNNKFYNILVIIPDFFICVQTDRHVEANRYIFTVLRWERARKPSLTRKCSAYMQFILSLMI